MTRRFRARDDEGAVLVMALAFVALFGLLVGGVLNLTQANLKTTAVVRARIAADYTGGAAVDGAINAARSVLATGVDGYDATCFSLPAHTVNANAQVDVRCTGQPGSGTSSAPRDVVFSAVAGGVTLLRAEVTFTDGTGTADGTFPHVVSWSQQ
jgi:hypothetical protein